MAIVRCPKGHFYDDEKFTSCPSCAGSSGPRWQIEDDKTVSLEAMGESFVKRIQLTAEEPVRQSVTGSWDNEKTVALSGYESTQLLVGWLVCISGPGKGKDYRLYPGFNRAGRAMDSDICIQDYQVSKDVHFSVVYDEKSGEFYLVPGKGTITYFNEETVQEAVKLKDGDRIKAGESVLEFVAFCKGEHTWQKM